MHLSIIGQVQGVSFRYYARQRAQALGLCGWVRNRSDGTVEVAAQGEEKSVNQFVAWANEGPPMASVERVEVEREEPEAGESIFKIVD